MIQIGGVHATRTHREVIMAHGKAFTRFHRFLAKRKRRLLRMFLDNDMPRDVLLEKFKRRKAELYGT